MSAIDIDSIDSKSLEKNCGLCAHQPVCSAFALFKTTIEPNILNNEKAKLKAENLAWICSLYEEEVQLGRIKQSRIVRQ